MFDPTNSSPSCLRLVEASLSTWNPDRHFNLITCVHGLHYIGDKLGLISRAASWLGEAGLFVANLDLANLKISYGLVGARRIISDLRRVGLGHDRRKWLVTSQGRKAIAVPY